MLVYLILIFAIITMFVVKDNLTQKSNKLIYVLLCILIICIVGFRDISVGNDSSEYKRFYLSIINDSFIDIFRDNTRIELGFRLYMKFLTFISTDYHFFFIVTAILSLTPIFVVIYKYSRNYYFSLALFVLMRFMFEHMNILRQALAIGILFIALDFFIRKKILKSLIMISIAVLFHTTAIVFVALLLASLVTRRVNKENVKIWLLLAVLMYFLGDFILRILFEALPQFSHYSSSNYFQKNNLANFINIIICLVFISMLFLYNGFPKRYQFRIIRGSRIKSEYRLTRLLILAMLLSLVLFALALRASLLDRVASYFYIFAILYVPNIIEKYSKKDKSILYSLTTVALLAYFVVTLVFRPEWNAVVPYVFWG